MWAPKRRSAPTAKRAAASGGKAIRTRTDVMKTFQVKIGMRHMVMPGARMQTTVVMKLTAPRMVPKPDSARPNTHRSPPMPGVNVVLFRGAYAVQPKEADPCGVMKPETAMVEPNRKNQKASAFRRGNATSGAPICRGMITLANPANSGVANISSMTVPCMVNSWLYCSLVCRICMPGSKSSARISRAMTPPRQKNTKDAIRYMYPMVLWSVEVIQLTTMRPLDLGTTGADRTPVGADWVYVATSLPLLGFVQVRVAVVLNTEQAGVAFSLELIHVGLEFRFRHHLDAEQHFGVVLAAEFGTLTVVGALFSGGEPDVVGLAGNHVALLQEGGNPEGVDDIAGVELEVNGLVHRQVQRGELFLVDGVAGEVRLDAGLVEVFLDDIAGLVVEVPCPLLAADVHDDVGRL